ncbi:MAG TPA: beta-phosphoglucomutase family hydrolase [Acidimicrobiales bacterium]|nr:beta-phosphoglucomutase family hydrolase [Acidimicrobiales bacterium]
MLGLPDDVRACLFDLDGVLTSTAKVHAAAWKEMFDGFLSQRAVAGGHLFVPFDIGPDYLTHVDGKPRADGTRAFLSSRGIELPEGGVDDGPETETVRGLGLRKNELVLRLIREGGVEAYPGSVEYLRRARDSGLARVVVSSSTNCHDVLVAAGLIDLVDGYIDGIVAEQRHVRGKPAPDTFLAGAELAGVTPDQAAVFEDALAGVEAGRAGGFRTVVGVDRVGPVDPHRVDDLLAHGADLVVGDLRELLDRPLPGREDRGPDDTGGWGPDDAARGPEAPA